MIRGLTLALILTASTAFAQTPSDRVTDIESDLAAIAAKLAVLKGELNAPPPPLPPGVVTTAAELVAQVAKCDGVPIKPVKGVYFVNLVIACSVEIVGADLSGFAPNAWVPAGTSAAVKLLPADGKLPVLSIVGSVSTVKVSGISIETGTIDQEAVVVGDPNATDSSQVPDNVLLDGLEVNASPQGGFRGIAMHARAVTVTRSRVTGFRHLQRDAQAVFGCNGPGPYTVSYNWLEGSGENVLFGGGSHRSAQMVPTNVVVRGNYIYKPQAWRKTAGALTPALVKNSVECKSCNGALIEGNTIDGNWLDGQDGQTIVLTPRNQYKDSPWVVVRNVIIRDNTIINHSQGYAVSILYTDDVGPTQNTADVTIDHNLFQSPKGIRVIGGVAGKLTVTRNTLPIVRWNLMEFARGTIDQPTKLQGFVKVDLVATGNVAKSGDYGVSGQNVSPGMPTFTTYTVNPAAFTGNVIEKTSVTAMTWPAGNTLLAVGTLAGQLDSAFHYTPNPQVGW